MEERYHAPEQRLDSTEEREQPPSSEKESAPTDGTPWVVPPSPQGARAPVPPLSKASSGMGPPEPMKRSFYHHARPNDGYNPDVPPDFVPPKRAKVMPAGPRGGERDLRRPPSFFTRDMSWESRGPDDGYYYGHPRSSPRYEQNGGYYGGPPPPPPPHNYPRGPGPVGSYREDEYIDYSRPRSHPSTPRGGPNPYPQEGGYHGLPPQRWGHHDSWEQSPRRSPGSDFHPPSSHGIQYRDDFDAGRGWSRDPRDDPRHARYDHHERYYHNGPYHGNSYYGGPSLPPMHQKMPPMSPRGGSMPPLDHGAGPVGRSQSMEDDNHVTSLTDANGKPMTGRDGPLLLLALPTDRISLSETLCVVRENIEVFRATKTDVDAPAPGRKHSVVVGQVGLRCIHCRHTTRTSERVKRAVCYPSSIKRIYRTVIDMKLDHFLQCKFVPASLKERLAELKVKHTRSTGTTMQYFIRAAHSLGLEDGTSGVCINPNKATHALPGAVLCAPQRSELKQNAPIMSPITEGKPNTEQASYPGQAPPSASEYRPIGRNDSLLSDTSAMTPDTPQPETQQSDSELPDTFFTGKINLAVKEDKMALSPLRCFLRSQVCAFSATAEDIAVRAPTTFSISVGQVGIGCIHCVNQPSKLRSNRAVCFPFSISRIYQSVADIQRFHFGECKMLPDDVKAKFLSLQKASSKGSKGLATRQYWITSAKKLGLADTPNGIRFARDPSKPEQNAMSLDILAQVAFNVTTASRALVLPEDKPFIAEFLYVVMEQLQPCRFTEADRNKRRLKDVGCIGVECKHCAGQVDGRKFFWSSVNAVESNFVSVHTHVMECRCVPTELKEKLGELKKLRKEQTAALKTGSQKAFFARVWNRLHGKNRNQDGDMSSDNSATSVTGSPTNSPAISSGCPSPIMDESNSAEVNGVSDNMKQMSVVEI